MQFNRYQKVDIVGVGPGRVEKVLGDGYYFVSSKGDEGSIYPFTSLRSYTKPKEDDRTKDELLEQLERLKETLTFTTDTASTFTLEHFQDDREHQITLNITIKKENK